MAQARRQPNRAALPSKMAIVDAEERTVETMCGQLPTETAMGDIFFSTVALSRL